MDNWQDSSLVSNSSQVRYSGCLGFVYEDQEFAVLGTTEGSSFFLVSPENKLLFIDEIPGAYSSAQAITREYKSYSNYMYAIADEGTASLQIIDLSYLPDSVYVVNEIQDARVGRAHTLFIDSANALLYLCSVTPIVNGQEQGLVPLRIFSLADPLDPLLVWEGFEDLAEVHDMELRDEIAILNCGFDGIRVYDFTNPIAPFYLSNLEFYQGQGYNHQGSLSPDKQRYVFADETPGTKLKYCAVSEGYDIQVQQQFGVENVPYEKTPHNIYISNALAYVAYYNDGLRIYDLRTNPPIEVGYYDTHTDLPGNTFSMWGAWGISATLPSQRILISDRISGLFLFDFDRELFESTLPNEDVFVYPNPAMKGQGIVVRVSDGFSLPFELRVLDGKGAMISESFVSQKSYVELSLKLSSGLYFLEFVFPESPEQNLNPQKLVID